MSDYVEILRDILDLHQDLDLSVDIIFVNKLVFLLNTSKGIKFTAIKYIPNQMEKEIGKYINNILHVYSKRGINIDTMYMDPEFECLK